MSGSSAKQRYLQRMFVPPLIVMAIFTIMGVIKGKSVAWIAATLVVTVPPSCLWVLFVYAIYLVFGRRARPASF